MRRKPRPQGYSTVATGTGPEPYSVSHSERATRPCAISMPSFQCGQSRCCSRAHVSASCPHFSSHFPFSTCCVSSLSPRTSQPSYRLIMVYYMWAGGTVPSFGHTPIWIDCSHGIRSTTRACHHRATPETPGRASSCVAATGPVTQSPRKSSGPSTLRQIFGCSKLSRMKPPFLRSMGTCGAHSPAPISFPTEPHSNALRLPHEVRKEEARAIVCKTRALESVLPLLCLESDDSDELPPQYGTLVHHPFLDTEPGNHDQTTVYTSNSRRKKGLGFMSNKLGERVSNRIKTISTAARSAQAK